MRNDATISSFENISLLIQKLNLEDSNVRLKQLQDIKTILVSCNNAQKVKAEDVKSLFSSLDSETEEEVEVACYIIDNTLASLDCIEVLQQLSSYLLAGLLHLNHDVNDLVLRQLTRMLDTSATINALIESPEIVGKVIDLLSEDDVAIASSANKLLSSFGIQSPRACMLMLKPSSDSLLQVLMNVMNKNDTVRFRVYELVCNLGESSEEVLDICVNSGILNRLFREFKGDDILVKVTCCSMLADFISAPHVLHYLVQTGVVTEMIETIKNSANDPFASLYVPAVVRFFGKVCLYNGARYIIEIFGSFVTLLISMLLEPSEKSVQQTAVETIGVVGRTTDGKISLSEQGKIKDALREISKLTSCSDVNLQEASVITLANLFDHSLTEEEEKYRITPITFSWFHVLSNNPLGFVVSLCKQPQPPVKIAAYNLLTSLTTCDWGLRCMQEHPSFIEFILDRTYETEINCKQSKYDLITTLSKIEHCCDIFGNRDYLRFRQYVNEGPHYVQTQLQVAVEDA